jgi:bidirectional [NiFe] hydrogenase diaphorase subunit
MDLPELLEIAARERQTQKPLRICCCVAAGCLSTNALAVQQGLEEAVNRGELGDRIQVKGVGCHGLCGQGPIVRIDPGGTLYQHVIPTHAPAIVAESLRDLGEPLPEPFRQISGMPVAERVDANHPFFTRQLYIVREHSGTIDPERIEDYLAVGGYQSLHHVLHEMSPHQVVDTITRSGLRGRGGAGYPTGLKWATVAKAAVGTSANGHSQKYVICNADEGDPGAYMDRSVLESDPHRVLEGMAIAAYAVGANQGYIYIRAEYPLAINRLQIAIQQARKLGLLGSQIFESPFNFRIDLRMGAGAFVCGEETALMASIEGKRGLPRPRPPYPAESGLWGCPTLINNVETFANVPAIIRNGADWFASIGTENSKGTKVFSLTGKIRYSGLIEVPMGTTLRQIVEEMGGGVPHGSIKAVQTGGPSGGCIPASALDTPVDYESLLELGSIMGSGGMIVIDESTNMVDVARFFMEFCMDESCGKCIPCRVGTVQLYRLLTKIRQGNASPADLELLEELCDMVQHTSLCGLGQAAPNPVLSTLRYFRDEYLALLETQHEGAPLSDAPV